MPENEAPGKSQEEPWRAARGPFSRLSAAARGAILGGLYEVPRSLGFASPRSRSREIARALARAARVDKAGTLLGSFVIADDSVHLDALAVDMKGGVVLKGRLDNKMADFNGQMLAGDSFLARLGPAAEWVWGKGFVGDAASPWFVSVGPMGSVFLFGPADGPLDFGSGVLSGGSVPNEDVVLAKFKP